MYKNKIYQIGMVFITLMVLTFIVVACQPTPEDLVIQNKNDGELMNAIQTTPVPVVQDATPEVSEVGQAAEPSAYKTVDHVSFTDELVNSIKLTADADILMPNVEAYPVVTYRRREFTQDEVDRILQVLIGDKPLYEMSDRMRMTKANIENMIVQISLEYKDLDAPMAQVKGFTSLQKLHEERDEVLEWWYRELKTAPESIDYQIMDRRMDRKGLLRGLVPCDTTMMELRIYNNDCGGALDYSDVGIKLSTESISGLLNDVRQESTLKSCTCFIGDAFGDTRIELDLKSVTDKPEAMTITPEEAKTMAETMFHDIGAGEDVRVTQVYYLEISVRDVKGYMVELKRHIGDMPIEAMSSYDAGKEKRSKDEGGNPFNAGVPKEIMSVFITDQGIADFYWREPLEVVAVENQNVALAETDKVIDVFKQEFKNGWSAELTDYSKEIANNKYLISMTIPTYTLYEVKLGYGIARKPNENDIYMAIPLWDFYGVRSQIREFVDPDGVDQTREDSHDGSILTINGIDHSRFSRRWGY